MQPFLRKFLVFLIALLIILLLIVLLLILLLILNVIVVLLILFHFNSPLFENILTLKNMIYAKIIISAVNYFLFDKALMSKYNKK